MTEEMPLPPAALQQARDLIRRAIEASRLIVLTEGGPRLRLLGSPGGHPFPADPVPVPADLLADLRTHRETVLAFLRLPPRQWLWRTGCTATEETHWPTFADLDHHPVGAWWWRFVGEPEWRPVPGRNPDKVPTPETWKESLEKTA